MGLSCNSQVSVRLSLWLCHGFHCCHGSRFLSHWMGVCGWRRHPDILHHEAIERNFEAALPECCCVSYWRKELGGNPDPDDPYDLQVPCGFFKKSAKMNDALFRDMETAVDAGGGVRSNTAIWDKLLKEMEPSEEETSRSHEHHLHQLQEVHKQAKNAQKVAVAGIF